MFAIFLRHRILFFFVAVTEPSLSASAPYRNLARVAFGVGGFLLLGSACGIVSFLLIPLLQTAQPQATNTAVLSATAFAFGYGAMLLLVGRVLQKNERHKFLRLPSPLVFVAAFFLALFVGQSILALRVLPAYLFPFVHVVASLCAPLAILAFAVRRLETVSLHSMCAQFSWGGFVTIVLALVFELIIGGLLFVLAFVGIAIVLGSAQTTELLDALQFIGEDSQRVIELVTAQPLVIVIVAFAVLTFFVLIVPLLEEILKTTGAAILIARRVQAALPPRKSQALLWGLAAGAGFAFTENLFNTQGAVTEAQGVAGFWASAMLLRSGTSLMHMTASATVAVGWYEARVHKKTTRLFLLLAAAVLAHAVWNSVVVLVGAVSLLNVVNENLAWMSTLLSGAGLMMLVLLFIVFSYWFVRLIRWAQPPVEIITSENLTGLAVENTKEF